MRHRRYATRASSWIGAFVLVVAAACDPIYTFHEVLAPGGISSLHQLPDGAYLLGGTYQNTKTSFFDAALIRMNAAGEIEWMRFYPYTNLRGDVNSIQPTADGGYILAGELNGPLPPSTLLVKTDANGWPLWERTYDDYPYAIAVTETEGGYVFAARTPGGSDYHPILVKTDRSGEVLWATVFARTNEPSRDMVPASDGGFVVVSSNSPGGVITKTDQAGQVVWTKSASFPHSIRRTSDDGYIVAGGKDDVSLKKIDAAGNTVWSKSYGGSASDTAWAVAVALDGGDVLAGETKSAGVGVSDAYLVKTDASGNLIWEKTFGGSGSETAYAVLATADGGFMLGGNTGSIPGIYVYGHVVKTDADGNAPQFP